MGFSETTKRSLKKANLLPMTTHEVPQ